MKTVAAWGGEPLLESRVENPRKIKNLKAFFLILKKV